MHITSRHRRAPRLVEPVALAAVAVALLAAAVLLAYLASLQGMTLLAFGALVIATATSVHLQRLAFAMFDERAAVLARQAEQRRAARDRHPATWSRRTPDVEQTRALAPVRFGPVL